ncbi:MAG: sigma-54 dependent transcriptional regulator [Acidobacteriota bacterium]|nr:sigma-54 dependent transcriptional regulator [Acidobacteriota bacterium]MDW3228953.1 sigma-54 dependent transcriptional regulator [Acidobacteriota bacterium]MDY0232160.1 sigma-54 dependent transcriptional regulator [Candidatus Saccharicenans sp.]
MTHNALIHLIDDEPIIHDVLGQLLEAEGYEVEISSSGEEALKKFEEQKFDLILLDLLMPGMDGLEVLKEIKKIDPETLVIIITAYASVESALSAIKMGAYDYIQKPFKNDELLMTINRALEHRHLEEENIRLKDELKKKFSFNNIIGKSQPMINVFELIKAAAPTRSTILIQGESGTGKELVARALHLNSDRANHPFIVVNSGSLPPDLLESHLFGHVKGAFTGAVTDKKGLFEAADKGSIFFDEISSISPETQVKLLRVMQDREFMRLGGTKNIKVDVRIIAATNTDLERLIEQKIFREDLYYRLNVIKIELPPLRSRKEDIPLLVKHFIELFSKENNKQVEDVSEDVMKILMDYDWPGNVRELENVIERAVVLCKSKIITREVLPSFLVDGRRIKLDEIYDSNLNLKENITEFQKKLILSALEKSGGVQKRAAQLLGLKPTTLNEMLKRLGINS